jgi:hypothetical protein
MNNGVIIPGPDLGCTEYFHACLKVSNHSSPAVFPS